MELFELCLKEQANFFMVSLEKNEGQQNAGTH